MPHRRRPHRIPRIPAIHLSIPPSVERQFRALARKAFPKETLAYLLGYDLGTRLEVTQLWVPPPESVLASVNSLIIPAYMDWEACQAAFEEDPDLCVLGDLHTHPYTTSDMRHLALATQGADIVPSSCDWGCRQGLRWITGVCAVWQTPSKRLFTEFAYWGPLTPLDLKLAK